MLIIVNYRFSLVSSTFSLSYFFMAKFCSQSLEGKRKSLRSSSIDDGYGSDKENCDDDLSSNTTTTSIEKVAESRNVGKALL
jgi:hypothetical protein